MIQSKKLRLLSHICLVAASKGMLAGYRHEESECHPVDFGENFAVLLVFSAVNRRKVQILGKQLASTKKSFDGLGNGL